MRVNCGHFIMENGDHFCDQVATVFYRGFIPSCQTYEYFAKCQEQIAISCHEYVIMKIHEL